MGVNDIQIGGTHYKAKYQHWDFAIDTNMPYTLACACKYIWRYQLKEGYRDLLKAKHYIEKSQSRGVIMSATDMIHVEKFVSQLSLLEGSIIRLICKNDFYTAIKGIDKISAEHDYKYLLGKNQNCIKG